MRCVKGGVSGTGSIAGNIAVCIEGDNLLHRRLEIEQFLKLLVERNAEDERKLGCRVELSRFDGADRVSGHPRQLGKLCLRESTLLASLTQ